MHPADETLIASKYSNVINLRWTNKKKTNKTIFTHCIFCANCIRLGCFRVCRSMCELFFLAKWIHIKIKISWKMIRKTCFPYANSGIYPISAHGYKCIFIQLQETVCRTYNAHRTHARTNTNTRAIRVKRKYLWLSGLRA